MQSIDKRNVDGRRLAMAIILIGLFVTASGRTSARADDPASQKESSSQAAPITAATPSPPDFLWKQVSECIQAAIRSDSFGPVPIPAKPPVPTRIYVFRPMDANAQIGLGFTILKDTSNENPSSFLTISSKIVTGIDDPQVNFFTGQIPSSSYSRNYWISAWSALDYTVNKLYQLTHPQKSLGPGKMGLAINSADVRRSNQLHIHMSCINKVVQETLSAANISTTQWTRVSVPFSYNAILLTNLSQNPFLVMRTAPGYTSAALETLVVTGKPNTNPQTIIFWRTIPSAMERNCWTRLARVGSNVLSAMGWATGPRSNLE